MQRYQFVNTFKFYTIEPGPSEMLLQPTGLQSSQIGALRPDAAASLIFHYFHIINSIQITKE